ncbi:DUF6228 family protein [Streptomyces sp. NPDC048349]|uniref:DUF6228 family protein n=1 Tax=Streptomyces sp. NPDC048349 TaxID=3155486 RepID=UPI0034162CEA
MNDFRSDNPDEQPGVAVVCRDNASVRVRFGGRESSDGYCVHYAVEIQAPGLSARIDRAVAWAGGHSELAPFLDQLAADFAGWDGERCWETNDRDLVVSAVCRSGGYVGLTWTLRPWRNAARGWNASVTTWLEAGEQMRSLAADIRHFIDGQAS